MNITTDVEPTLTVPNADDSQPYDPELWEAAESRGCLIEQRAPDYARLVIGGNIAAETRRQDLLWDAWERAWARKARYEARWYKATAQAKGVGQAPSPPPPPQSPRYFTRSIAKALKNRCVQCGTDMGDCNPRQYCGKTHCDHA